MNIKKILSNYLGINDNSSLLVFILKVVAWIFYVIFFFSAWFLCLGNFTDSYAPESNKWLFTFIWLAANWFFVTRSPKAFYTGIFVILLFVIWFMIYNFYPTVPDYAKRR